MTATRGRLWAYGVGVVAPAAAVVAVLVAAGARPDMGSGTSAVPIGAAPVFDVDRVLLAIAVVVAAAHVGGALGARLGQPRVVGQVAVGLLLGPSILGQVSPAALVWLQGGGAAPAMDLLAQLGVVLFAFLIGRELAGAFARRTWAAALVVGQVMVAVRPLAVWVSTLERESSYLMPGLLLCGLLACAVATDRLGLNPIFGGLLVGMALPPTSVTARRVTVMAEGATEWLLLPMFFIAVGRRAHLGLLSDWSTVGVCLLVLFVAMASKIAAAGAAGWASGFTWRDATALGVMMNCRGLTELLLLNLGLTAGIIDVRTFTVFVVMALVTTAATGPLLDLLGLHQIRNDPVPERSTRPAAPGRWLHDL